MRMKSLALSCLCLSFFTSCIKEEGPDREADITELTINEKEYLTTLYNENSRVISLIIADTTGYFDKRIAPQIKVSKGAVILPASGDSIDLIKHRVNNTTPSEAIEYEYIQHYTVTAQNGDTKMYTLKIVPYKSIVMDFEDWYQVKANANRIYDLPENNLWINANQGVAVLYRDNERFPTAPIEDPRPGSTGHYSVELKTVYGNENSFDLMNIPIYAGNMFLGKFDFWAALTNPLKTTLFGQPHPKEAGKPLKLIAWYKYIPGTEYTTWEYVNGKKSVYTTSEIKDRPDLYAVLYKVPKGQEGQSVYLTGEDINSSERIVARARLEDYTEKREWTRVSLDFAYTEELNYEESDYKLAIVLSSSFDGANYKGAIGSVLQVDDLRIVSEIDPYLN